MHLPSDPVTAVVAYDAASFGTRKALDGRADVAKTCAFTNDRDARIPTAPRDVDDMTRFRGCFDRISNDERRRGVAMKATETRRDVDVDDVTHLEALVTRRNSMTHDRVATRAHGGRKSVIAELTRSSAATKRVCTHPVVDVGRCDSRAQASAYERERFSRRFARRTQSCNGASIVDLDRHGLLIAPVD